MGRSERGERRWRGGKRGRFTATKTHGVEMGGWFGNWFSVGGCHQRSHTSCLPAFSLWSKGCWELTPALTSRSWPLDPYVPPFLLFPVFRLRHIVSGPESESKIWSELLSLSSNSSRDARALFLWRYMLGVERRRGGRGDAYANAGFHL